jgi:hypothetical protein
MPIKNTHQDPIDSSYRTPIKHQLPISAVDELTNELINEYNNERFKRWYCGVIYEFGVSQVLEWRGRAHEGKEPSKLFSKYVIDARTYRKKRGEEYETS